MHKSILLALFVIVNCASSAVVPSRQYFPEENNINYKRFLLVQNGVRMENIDLLNEQVTLTAEETHVTYYLYTPTNKNDPHIINNNNLKKLSGEAQFDPNRHTFLLIHGWIDSHEGNLNKLTKTALLEKQNVNVIVVDWNPVASQNYITAKIAVTNIGQFVANFITNMKEKYNIDNSKFTLIGHSLGAHIAGIAGSTLGNSIHQIIGLDPAAPLFNVDNTEDRLDANDANYVQVIHTNGRLLGFASSLGHADFYPNEGMVQAGCGLDLIGSCSHSRAYEYLAEAISGGKFTATLCSSYNDYKKGECNNNRKVLMGQIPVDKTVIGDYFLDTNTAAPFAQG